MNEATAFHSLGKNGLIKSYTATDFWSLLRMHAKKQAEIRTKLQDGETWQSAHERFVRNQEYRIKKHEMSLTAEKYIVFSKQENYDSDDDETDCKLNPFQDEDLMKTVALAEKRHEQLNELQTKRVLIAQRRQKQFVAVGHARDIEFKTKMGILKVSPPKTDFSDMVQNHLSSVARVNQNDQLGLLKTPETYIYAKNVGERRKNNIKRSTLQYTPKNVVKSTDSYSKNDFRLKFPDKAVTVADVMPAEYKLQHKKLVQAKCKPMSGKNIKHINSKWTPPTPKLKEPLKITPEVKERTWQPEDSQTKPLTAPDIMRGLSNYDENSKLNFAHSKNLLSFSQSLKLLKNK